MNSSEVWRWGKWYYIHLTDEETKAQPLDLPMSHFCSRDRNKAKVSLFQTSDTSDEQIVLWTSSPFPHSKMKSLL